MASDGPTIRFARREDVASILQLIRELAEYEHELDNVEATEETLLRTIAFAPSPPHATAGAVAATEPTETTSPDRPARCLLLFTPEGVPAGMALYFYNYSTWRARPGIYLEDLFVRASQRKHGYGRKLLVALAQEVVAMGGGRLEWSVLKWNEPSIKFYESLGAQAMSGWVGMRVDGEALVKLAQSEAR
ncbi:gcn5-related n-acetyltransferase [Niveomyces insectorum RCEF 264]|uniref:Gcn5-related n-acetyltransferase n=1 Tax=Niveomyces insectorum RCEF 264 TaxID=1081102 RepID=A0A167XMS3_9HYPO|nr:gcn5-related n-acetyltransferase [Niveomyces insectorum RCEF 264]